MTTNTKKLVLMLLSAAAFHSSFVGAEEKKMSPEEMKSIKEKIDIFLKEMKGQGENLTQEKTYPQLRRVSLDHTNIDGNTKDFTPTLAFGAPTALGSNDLDVWRLGVGVQLSKDVSAGIALSTTDGEGTTITGNNVPGRTIDQDSEADGISGSIRYQIKDWLSVGVFAGFSNGDSTQSNRNVGARTFSTTKNRGHSEGVFLSGVHAFDDQWMLAVSPSYSHSSSTSKTTGTQNGGAAFTANTRFTRSTINLDHNLTYFFDNNNVRATAGYTHHWITAQTTLNPNLTDRESYYGTGYLGATWSHKSGYEIYGNLSRDFSDAVYDDNKAIMLGVAKTWR